MEADTSFSSLAGSAAGQQHSGRGFDCRERLDTEFREFQQGVAITRFLLMARSRYGYEVTLCVGAQPPQTFQPGHWSAC